MTGIALFFGMIGLACAIVIGVGLWTRKRLQRASPDPKALARLTPTGAAVAFAAFANILARLGHPVARDRKPGR
ncbi:MAG: hypothetical protein K8F93_18510 [Burkholderiales bacterium]|jgi:hypothetical protein|nr:hypothetical protein [Burkholderiales bacterium]MBZ0251654.1 hypothetical protein [Burkholderiales bacterium]HQY45542.1 hypothetical protein [Usitatibacteraceae bacterium]